MDVTTANVIKTVSLMADVVLENEVHFCDIDSVAGDGDLGMSLSKGFKQIKKDWEEIPKEDIGVFLNGCGMLLTEHCGGASGPLWGTAFRTMAKYAKNKEKLEASEIGELLSQAVVGIQKIGGAKLGDKTLLDALIPAAEAVKTHAHSGVSVAIKEGAKAAQEGAERTKKFKATKGRASYVGERSLNHPDAGAVAIAVIFNNVIERFCDTNP